MATQPTYKISTALWVVILIPSSLLVYSGLYKWWWLPSTRLLLQHSPLRFISHHASLIAWISPAVEIAVACFIISHNLRRLGFVLSTLLFCLFSIYLIQLFNGPKGTVCACGGFLGSLGFRSHMVVNGIAFISSVSGIWLTPSK